MIRPTAFLVAALALSACDGAGGAVEMPAKEKAFCDAVEAGRAALKKAIADKNYIRREPVLASARPERRAAFKAILAGPLGGGEVEAWVGTVSGVGRSTQGAGRLTIDLPCRASIRTIDNVEIDAAVPLFAVLSTLDIGQKVRLSGTFLPAAGVPDHFLELSLTTEGSLAEPEFAFLFNSIEPLVKGR